jgi:hypothetical protein
LKYVALHHFYPVLLQEKGLVHHYDKNDRLILKDTVPVSAVRASSIGQSTVYSVVYFFIPSFTVECVDEDLKQIKHQADVLVHAGTLAARGIRI